MKKKRWSRLLALLVLGLSVSLLAGCGAESTEAAASKEDAETIQVYLWTTNLYDTYAPYIQSQLPDVNIEFVVGHNDLDFYKFLQENGGLPDIITCCRFSLHDAAPLKGSLMNLAMTNEAGAVYNNYLTNFMNEDGSINWLPVCADAHGFVVNRGLFEKYDIPLPTDYDSFVSACQAFAQVGVRGFTADYVRLRNGVPDMAACDSLENGVILLYNRICAKANAELDILLEESEIDRILRGEDQDAAPEVIALAEREAQEFINDLLSGLRERMLELKSGKVIFLGGGATLLRRQIEASGKIGQAIFVEDINANAKGYEYLYRLQHSGR